jgi:hypothetical protein
MGHPRLSELLEMYFLEQWCVSSEREMRSSAFVVEFSAIAGQQTPVEFSSATDNSA